MNAILYFIFAPLQPFIDHPGRIAAVAGLLAIMSVVLFLLRRHGGLVVMVAAVLWAVFAMYEYQWYLGKMGPAPWGRWDYLFFWPPLLVFTIGALIAPWVVPTSFWGKWRFSLLTLLVVVTILAVAMGLVAMLL